MVDQVGAAHDRAPQRHRALVGGLRVDGVRRRGVRRPERQPVVPRQLAAGLRGLGVLGRAERRRAAAHVDVRGERAVDQRRARAASAGSSATHASTSAFCSTSAPARVAGAIAPASVNGVTHTACPAPANSIRPSAIGMSSVNGVLVLTMARMAGSAAESVAIRAQRDGCHVDAIGSAVATERDPLPALVEQPDQAVVQVEVSSLGRQVHRLERSTTLLMDDVDALDELQVLACSAVSPGRRPRSMSWQNAGPPTEPNATWLPPITRSCSGLRARSVNTTGQDRRSDQLPDRIAPSARRPHTRRRRRALAPGGSTRMPVWTATAPRRGGCRRSGRR